MRILPILLATLLLPATPNPASSQTVAHNLPISDLLSKYVLGTAERNVAEVRNAIGIILSENRRPPSEIDALVSGLAELARSGPTDRVRADAVVLLMAETSSLTEIPPYTRVGPLVLEIFRQTDSPLVRGVVVRLAGYLGDKPVAVQILRQVLTAETPVDVADPEMYGRLAVGQARAVGPPGLALLRELHSGGSIHNEHARSLVAELSARGALRGGGMKE